jgi:hypothetical protein
MREVEYDGDLVWGSLPVEHSAARFHDSATRLVVLN